MTDKNEPEAAKASKSREKGPLVSTGPVSVGHVAVIAVAVSAGLGLGYTAVRKLSNRRRRRGRGHQGRAALAPYASAAVVSPAPLDCGHAPRLQNERLGG